MAKKLYKSRNKKIDGVCAGFAEYFEIDPTLVRLLWIAAIFLGFSGILAYIICMIVMQEKPADSVSEYDYVNEEDRRN